MKKSENNLLAGGCISSKVGMAICWAIPCTSATSNGVVTAILLARCLVGGGVW
jgi:hypothetical protein